MPQYLKNSNYKTGGTAQMIRQKESRRQVLPETYHSFQNLAKTLDNNLGNAPSLRGLENGTAIGWFLER